MKLFPKIRIYTTVWGERYIDLFEQTILRSFSWPQNKQAILNEDYTWSIHTNKKDIPRIEKLLKDEGFKNLEFSPLYEPQIEPHDAKSLRVKDYVEKEIDGPHNYMGLILLKSFTNEIEQCLKEDSRLLIAPPDSLFGDGSVRGIFLCGHNPYTCVSVAHPRVLDSILPETKVLRNCELVTLSWEHLHKTWREANVDRSFINSYVGGVQWQKISEDLYRVSHRLPTPYLLHFKDEDLTFFKQQICFGTIDHIWPTNLMGEERIRHIGSSDLAFIVEITAACQNIPPSYPTPPTEPDKFWRRSYHNQIYRQFQTSFRGVKG